MMPLAPWGILDPEMACESQNVVLEFLGRADFQVKIRGFRVELGEIEHALEALDDVSAAVVLALEGEAAMVGGRKEKYLVAFLTPASINVNSVKESLRRTLPEYMVPSNFV